MRFEITGSVDPLLSVTLEKGEKVLAESNAMVAMDGDLSLKGRSRGGIMKSLARKLLNDESFFQQYVEAEKGPGSVLLAQIFLVTFVFWMSENVNTWFLTVPFWQPPKRWNLRLNPRVWDARFWVTRGAFS